MDMYLCWKFDGYESNIRHLFQQQLKQFYWKLLGESALTSVSVILQSLTLKPFLASNTLIKLLKVDFI